MLRKTLYLTALAAMTCPFVLFAQKAEIDQSIQKEEATSHFRFLASDELMGRDAARSEIDIAARYIAEQFRQYGAQTVSGADEYYQHVPLRLSAPPKSGSMVIGDTEPLTHGQDMLVLDGASLQGEFELVVAGYGTEEDFDQVDVKGKIVVVRVGGAEKMNPSALFAAGRDKLALAAEHGALGLVEMYNLPNPPWPLLIGYLNKTQMTLGQNEETSPGLPYIWVKDLNNELIKTADQAGTKVQIEVLGKVNKQIDGKNVIALIEGTDPELKDEYLMLSAHYDHIGVGKPNAEGDSIYNGARDNAVGTVALINAAKYFAENPPKRSILLCAWTAEEKGLLGSAYYSENPLIPLNKVIYNLNIDNGGYNDISRITVIGLGRTSADHLIEEAVTAYGLETHGDPSPEQGLYDRSDNVNFAKKGIPAPTFSLGFTGFDEELMKYYHQVPDQVDNFDLDYAMKYWKAYLLTAENIANDPSKPKWTPGDKYEEVGNELYGN
ncbi:peptidase M28 [Echinicola pacifica]|uniref:Peptidase M28 n=1 Tax=Echinicola pacifica TaxID=346377 RepID=A0A918Q6Q8_9BACT|nr:M28 family peptidase [Echinicola pacifica]GGZ32823.1 peptidase M28 [Echinicola pacifica]